VTLHGEVVHVSVVAERLAAGGKIFRSAVLSRKKDTSLFNHFRVAW